jgi:hypothetical protein
MAQPERRLLLQILDEAFDKKAWHGTNLRGSIRGLTAKQASWRPGKRRPRTAAFRGRHNIWEVVVHCAYWKYTVRRRILKEQRGSFPLKGSNWFKRPEKGDEKEWKADVALLQRMHRELRRAVASLKSADLGKLSPKKQYTLAQTIYGVSLHDVYHAGQIQLLKRLMAR